MPNTQAPNTSRESPDDKSIFNGRIFRDRSESPGRMIFKDNEGDESPDFKPGVSDFKSGSSYDSDDKYNLKPVG